MNWNFFASSHGKGAVDGIGGMVKRIVWRAVKGRKAFVNIPEDFYRVALEKCKEIHLLTSKSLMLKVDIKNEEYDATKLSTRRRLHYEDAYSDESDDDKYESTGKDDAQMETDEEPIIKH
ncbi:hypothetical protein J6590_067667 [Homalodisca vitripennis]|nr:hypothetical protein J6590_067667 [Homalodisca vitripennis]